MKTLITAFLSWIVLTGDSVAQSPQPQPRPATIHFTSVLGDRAWLTVRPDESLVLRENWGEYGSWGGLIAIAIPLDELLSTLAAEGVVELPYRYRYPMRESTPDASEGEDGGWFEEYQEVVTMRLAEDGRMILELPGGVLLYTDDSL